LNGNRTPFGVEKIRLQRNAGEIGENIVKVRKKN